MIIVNTSVWVDLFRGATTPQTQYLRVRLGEEPFGIGDLILAEILQGCRSDTEARVIERRLRVFPCYRFDGQQIAVRAARHYRHLRSLGITVRRIIDVFIATYCIERSFFLLHNDRDFDPFEKHLGLRVGH